MTFNFQPITLFTCKKFVKELNINKPLGPSNIPAWALKDSISVIAEPLCFLINAFLNEGKFPSDLKQAHVCPIFKKGDTEDPNNYRPISITATLSKVFEKVICEQITNYIDINKLFSPVQFGFRKNISTIDALVFTTEKIRKEIDNNHFVAAAFLDLSKAFDSISHEILIKKLEILHFYPNAISLIQSFLTGRTQRVVLSTSKSDWINLYQGVPQGTVLGPLLFNLYVNSMQNIMPESSNLVQYADDTFVFVAANCINTGITNLERILEKIIDYFVSHRLNINADKTEFIVFCKPSKNASIKNVELQVQNHLFKQKECVKYLGVQLDQNLNYQNEVKNILRKMACGIKTIYCVRDFLPTKTRLLLLNALVISHLHYSSILLNGSSRSLISTLEKQLNWGIKACFNRYKMDSAHDLRLHYRILSVRHLLDLKACFFFWKWKYNLSPAFSRLQMATANLKTHERTLNLTYHSFANSEQLKNSLFKRVVPLWNALPEKLKLGNQTYEKAKKRLKTFFNEKFINDIDRPQYSQKCWSEYRFK